MSWLIRGCHAVVIATLVSGCTLSQGDPYNWSTGYREVSTAVPATDASGRHSTTLIVPAKCRTDGEPADDFVGLPLGCANDLNLQRMVERPSDLVQGREIGPARAAPVGAAAREVLENGRERAASRKTRLESAEATDSIATGGLP